MLAFNCPVNSVSFGQVSTALLRECYESKKDVCVLPIGDKIDISAQKEDTDFFQWVNGAVKAFQPSHKRENPAFRLWHFNGSSQYISDNQALFTFHELDGLTDTEVNIGKNNRLVLTSSSYSTEIFNSYGVNAKHVPLGFDAANFKRLDKTYYDDDRIVFSLCGKFEHRKHHANVLAAWAKKFGDDRKYFLHCALFNPFITPQNNNELIARALDHKKYFNMSFMGHMPTNAEYNDFLNSSNIILGMSGGEGWGLPEFQSVALGKHAVILNAHAYKDWATKDNSVMVDPTTKIEAYDGLFFKKGLEFNQGQIFDWSEDDFISACEEAIKRVESNRVNENGLKLQQDFTYKNTLSKIEEALNA